MAGRHLKAYFENVAKDWNPDDHPRGGDPANSGRFSHGGGGGAEDAEQAEARAVSFVHPDPDLVLAFLNRPQNAKTAAEKPPKGVVSGLRNGEIVVLEAKEPNKLEPTKESHPDAWTRAEALVARAKEAVGGIHASLQKAVGGLENVIMPGLAFELKGTKSTARKIETDYWDAQRRGENVSYDEVAAKVGDTVRYTVCSPDSGEDYIDTVNRVMSSLAEDGYELVPGKWKNTWVDGKPDTSNKKHTYQGINLNLVAPGSGLRIEVQFHTPASFFVKQYPNHIMYEEERVIPWEGGTLKEHERVTELRKAMIENQRLVVQPPGAHLIEWNGKEAYRRTSKFLKAEGLSMADYYRRDWIGDRVIYYKYDAGEFYMWSPKENRWLVSRTAFSEITGVGGSADTHPCSREEAMKATGGVA